MLKLLLALGLQFVTPFDGRHFDAAAITSLTPAPEVSRDMA